MITIESQAMVNKGSHVPQGVAEFELVGSFILTVQRSRVPTFPHKPHCGIRAASPLRSAGVIDTPPDDVLLELGRLIWAAINLEDVAYAMCRSIKPRGGPFDDTPVIERIRRAQKDLEALPDVDLCHRADRWLQAASEALLERNAVLHAVPATFEPLLPEITPGNLDPVLAHFPRDKSRSPVHTHITVAGLQPIRRRLEQARVGWTDLAVELSDARRNLS